MPYQLDPPASCRCDEQLGLQALRSQLITLVKPMLDGLVVQRDGDGAVVGHLAQTEHFEPLCSL